MSPHAVPLSDTERSPASKPSRCASSSVRSVATRGSDHRSALQRFDDSEIHDLICVGFGPASLAIAIALHDTLGEDTTRRPKLRFLEKQPQFAWHAGMLLPGAKMQISFIKDLATLRNPRSEFTFINYLHQKGRLVQFSNLGTFLPERIEYEDYLRWCASWFEDIVDYDQSVESVNVGRRDPESGAVEYFTVLSSSSASGQTSTLRARHVVVATGGKPRFPASLPTDHPRVLHSSQYATRVAALYPSGQQPRSVAVIGAGQSAAEVFHNLPSRFPDSKSYLLIRSAALRPSDDSPFVNEIFNPDRVDDVYLQDSVVRAKAIALDRATNYACVRLELLESIYSTLYSYQIQYGSEEQWPQRILPHRTVTGVTDCTIDDQPALQLQIEDNSGAFCARKVSRSETLPVDLVIVASGYQRDAHEGILKDLRHLMPGGNQPGKRWTVARDYSVQFRDGAVKPNVGVWLQGCNESTHGLADSLLSILAVRGGEIVHSIFGTLSD